MLLLPVLGVVAQAALIQAWPLGLTLWFAAMASTSLIPAPEVPEDLSRMATRMRRAGAVLRGKSKAMWRLSPPDMNASSRWAPLSMQSAAALCFAAVVAGVDLSLSKIVGEALVNMGVPDTPDVRHWGVSIASGFFGWVLAHAWIESGTKIGFDPNKEEPDYPPFPYIPCPLLPRVSALWQRKDESQKVETVAGRLMFAGASHRPKIAALWGTPVEEESPSLFEAFQADDEDDEDEGKAPKGRGKKFVALLAHTLPLALAGVAVAAAMGQQTVTSVVGWRGPTLAVSGLAVLITGWAEFRWDHRKQLRPWNYKQEQIDYWAEKWTSLRGVNADNAPWYHQEAKYPAHAPTHKQIVFGVKTGRSFADYARSAPELAPGLGKSMIVVEQHQVPRQRGKKHWGAIRLWHELVDLGERPHLQVHRDPAGKFDQETTDFAVRHAGLQAFSDLKLGWPIFITSKVLTHVGEGGRGLEDERKVIIESQWSLTDGMTFEQCLAATEKMQEKLQCEWARFHVSRRSKWVSLLFGTRPGRTRVADQGQSRRLMHIDWSYHMKACGLFGADGHPPYLEKYHMTDQGLPELTFELPPGLEPQKVESRSEALKTASGMGYLSFKEQPDPTKVTLVVGEDDPLERTYEWSDYTSQILKPAVPGSPDIDWCVGVMADGEPFWYRWKDENPHLLIAGSSGGGKSVIINSMVSQIVSKNAPEDVSLWMADPKNELQPFQHAAHVDIFLDHNVTDVPPLEAMAEVLKMAVEEMHGRYAAFSNHHKRPKNLARARELAIEDPSGAGNLNFPWLFLVIDECSSFFAAPEVKEQKEHHARVLALTEELGRMGRAAGVYLIAATQDPVKKNIPTTLKRQCRKIGLRTDDVTGSRVIIDQTGLEKLNSPGRGLVSGGKGYVGFRGLYQDEDELSEVLKEMPVDRRWPKLPPSVTPKPLIVGAPIIMPDGSLVDPVCDLDGEVA